VITIPHRFSVVCLQVLNKRQEKFCKALTMTKYSWYEPYRRQNWRLR